MPLQPTEELSFAGAHLSAYSYIYDKKSAATDRDVRAVYTLRMPDGDDIRMTMWMKGEADRKVFTALSPMTEGLSRLPDMPYRVKEQPTLTFVARQGGEAWNRPFVAVYEPSSERERGTVTSVAYPEVESPDAGSHVAVRVMHADGRSDLLLSSDHSGHTLSAEGVTARAAFAQYSRSAAGETCFMADGTLLRAGQAELSAAVPGNVLLEPDGDGWKYSASVPFTWSYGGQRRDFAAGTGRIQR